MKVRGQFWLAVLMIVILTVVTACGGNNKNTESNEQASPSTTQEKSTDKQTEEKVEEVTATESAPAQKPITFTFFDANVGQSFDNPVALEITKRTGVSLEIQQPTGNPSEKLNLMLASNDLPDLMAISRGDNLDKYIAAGALTPLNDLIDQYGPNIKEMYGDTLNKTRHTDGKNYYLANWYGLEIYPIFGFMMRMDMLQELGAEDKANNGEPFTAEEFVDLLKKFKEKYPTVNGKTSYAMTFNGENMGAVRSTFKGMYGILPYYVNEGKVYNDFKDPKFLDMIKFMNSLYTQGLIDPEWATNKTQQYEQKLASRAIFATTDAFWNLGTSNSALKADVADEAKKDAAQFYSYKVVADGIDPAKTTFGPKSSLGWDGIAITHSNTDPVRAIQFLDFLASEEGQYLMMWGLEGVHWDMKDGKHVPRQEVFDGFTKDWGAYSSETGIRKWTWTIKNGPGSDGTPYDLAGRYQQDPVAALAIKNLADTSFDTAPYDNLGPAGGTPEAIMQQKVTELRDKYFPRMVIADNEGEAEKLYNTMIQEMETAGLSKLEVIYTENYTKRMELWK